ncbi:hypothetical protein DSO57_1010353 [Entomophthora muscae]|uniref:Uncharacterized protein n=1 Tax=Entomophthora muscae TaxID=34485 RepID=A0ACC2UGL8_9FUNG|nr:hypothetical protein DSO57_1010353 [Entomophthora muscae]
MDKGKDLASAERILLGQLEGGGEELLLANFSNPPLVSSNVRDQLQLNREDLLLEIGLSLPSVEHSSHRHLPSKRLQAAGCSVVDLEAGLANSNVGRGNDNASNEVNRNKIHHRFRPGRHGIQYAHADQSNHASSSGQAVSPAGDGGAESGGDDAGADNGNVPLVAL